MALESTKETKRKKERKNKENKQNKEIQYTNRKQKEREPALAVSIK